MSTYPMQYFNNGLEVNSVFLDISKAFGNVWHEGIFSKLK